MLFFSEIHRFVDVALYSVQNPLLEGEFVFFMSLLKKMMEYNIGTIQEQPSRIEKRNCSGLKEGKNCFILNHSGSPDGILNIHPNGILNTYPSVIFNTSDAY